MKDTSWDHALKVTGDGAGLVGHAGAVLLRKAADQLGLTGRLSAALRKAGSPLNPRQIAKITAVGTQASGPHNAKDTGAPDTETADAVPCAPHRVDHQGI